MAGKLISSAFAKRIGAAVQYVERQPHLKAPQKKQPQILGGAGVAPYEIISEWTQEYEDGEWTCRARPVLWYGKDEYEYRPVYLVDQDIDQNDDDTWDDEVTLHAPLAYATSKVLAAGPPPPPDIGGSRRVMVQKRNGRYEVVHNDPAWIPARAYGDADVPPFGVCRMFGTEELDDGTELTGQRLGIASPVSDNASSPFYLQPHQWAVNGNGHLQLNNKEADDDNHYGFVCLARDRPVRALFSESFYNATGIAPARGEIWGPIGDASWALYPGLPGFECIGGTDTETFTAFFIAHPESWFWVKATADLTHGADLICQPLSEASTAGHAYDGTGGYPDVRVTLTLSHAYAGGSWVNYDRPGDWNIHEDDVFPAHLVRHGDGNYFWPSEIMMDDVLGTIKMRSSDSGIPKGWQEYTTQGDGIVGHGGGSPTSFQEGTGDVINCVRIYLIQRVACNVA